MSATTSFVVATGVIVTAGTWARGDQISPRLVVGGGFVMLTLAVMAQANEVFAERMALLILIAAVMTYGMELFDRLGAIE